MAGAALWPRTAAAEDAPKAATSGAAQPGKKLPPASQAEADARVQMVLARHGGRFKGDARAELSRLSRQQQELLDELRAFPLDYSDEPALQFRAPRTHR